MINTEEMYGTNCIAWFKISTKGLKSAQIKELIKEMRDGTGLTPQADPFGEKDDANSYFINCYDYARYVPFVEPEFSRKLERYRKDMEEDRQDFAARTDGTGLTRTFRMELKKFCGEFLPQQIRLEKRLWLVMDEEGRFSEKDGQIDGNLSRTEEILFEYLCFLQVNRFWGMVQKTMGRTVKKPLFIGALADGIDEGADLSPFMEQTLSLDRQAFVFTKDKNMERRLAGIDAEKKRCIVL